MSDNEAFRDSIRTALDKELDAKRVRAALESEDGYDAGLWKLMGELGWLAIHIPEEYDGLGGTFESACIVLQELSRKLAPSPYFSSAVLATAALLASQNEDLRRAYLPRLAMGELRGTFAQGGERGLPADIGYRWTARGAGGILGGKANFVLDPHLADFFIVPATTDSGKPALFLVDREQPGVEVSIQEPVDLTRRMGMVSIDNLELDDARMVAGANEGARVIDHVVKAAGIGLAAEAVGGAEQVLRQTVEYANTREQFGRKIGSFQAVKHGCAEMMVLVETARAAAEHAAATVTLGEELSSEAALIAKSYTSEAYLKVAGSGMQYHGGIGFTWEHDMHIHFKRAALGRNLFGLPGWHLDQLAGAFIEGAGF